MFTAKIPPSTCSSSRAAEVFGREAALFVPTGTMGNQIALRLLTQPGQEIICESRAHILDWEMATAAVFSGCLIRAVRHDRRHSHLEPDRAGHLRARQLPRRDGPDRNRKHPQYGRRAHNADPRSAGNFGRARKNVSFQLAP